MTDTPATLEDFIERSYRFISDRPSEWMLSGNVDLEVSNHVLRVFIQDNSVDRHLDQLLALTKAQHPDGGWGDRRDDVLSHERSTAFCTQMLLRAERQVTAPWLVASIHAGLAFVAGRQHADGSWTDHRWHTLDAVSTSVGMLLFALNDKTGRFAQHAPVLDRGMAFVDGARADTGLWFYKPKSSPVTITAHLIQKTAIYHGATALNIEAAHRLVALQHPEGHWDSRNVDHTCDATRSLMLTASQCAWPDLTDAVRAAACRAIDWIVSSVDPSGGLGDRPGRTPHVEATCDGLDTALKFRTFLAEHTFLAEPGAMSRFWH